MQGAADKLSRADKDQLVRLLYSKDRRKTDIPRLGGDSRGAARLLEAEREGDQNSPTGLEDLGNNLLEDGEKQQVSTILAKLSSSSAAGIEKAAG